MVSGWLAYSTLRVDHAVPLPPAIDAERQVIWDPEAGAISYYEDRRGRGLPLVLVHSVNAAASAREMQPLFEHFRGRRPVFAVDLPGFGFSERAERAYTPSLYCQALATLLRDIVGTAGGADVVALSLSSEFVAAVAAEYPELVSTIALISPTGFGGRSSRLGTERRGRRRRGRRVERVLRARAWSQPLFDALVSRQSLHHFLGRSFTGEVDPGLIAYAYATSHQPGARHAPVAFVSGRLFTPDVLGLVYASVPCPALVLFDQDGYTDFDRLASFVDAQRRWQAVRIPGTRGLPQFEALPQTALALQSFWARQRSRPGPPRPAPRLA
jgi:pimeloyl-ACP methyl ester carboxylesterase